MWGGSGDRGFYYLTEEKAARSVAYQNKFLKQDGVV
jgi:hypothetical protein